MCWKTQVHLLDLCMRKAVKNIIEISRLIAGTAVFLAPGLLGTWVVFILFFPDTLRRYEMSLLEQIVFLAGVLAIAYIAYKATPWRRVQDAVAPLYLYDDWFSSRGAD